MQAFDGGRSHSDRLDVALIEPMSDTLASRLGKFGYECINIDSGWQGPGTFDATGREHGLAKAAQRD